MTDTSASTNASHGALSGAMIARQAIMNGRQTVVGYELLDRSHGRSDHTAASDVLVMFAALSHAGAEELVGKTLLFVNCTHESLSGGHLELVNPEKIVLEIPALGLAATDEVQARQPLLAALRERGFHLAFNQTVLESTYAPWLPLADFIKLDLSVLPADQATVLINYAQRSSKAELIAEKIETAQQYDMVSSLGVELFQGYWFARPALVQTKLLSPQQAHIVDLLNLVRRQASTDEIEEVLKKDAGLAFNLMRLINSAGLGLHHEVSSFRQAVMLLGLKKLFRWAALLLTAARHGGPPPAVGQTAVVRGRFMELLAREFLDAEQADEAFLVGMFSMLDQMLGMPLDKALQLLGLPGTIVNQIEHHEGRLGQLLLLVRACETNDDSDFYSALQNTPLTSQQVNMAHLQALAWSDQMCEL
ncbi:EAL and HDOD domain-containing protein [Comamonas flocculans]|uniref:EAL domain-containing protein n=1 Tax=Comamonas flocculans TaxID=2597701 RepID=A0A5B8RZR8_9BURK|nr:HDOD domain-containing protein [Comamonas flocculans]QEA13765.1 EAL domain-containing protein [Comamonas flocculans]